MRGVDHQQSQMFSYLSPETRAWKDHPLREIRAMVDEVLTRLSRRFDAMYASDGRTGFGPGTLLDRLRRRRCTQRAHRPGCRGQ
jgi:hypothetical protein